MRLLYFNPENDLALAANDPHYTPPASALQLATDLQRLPLRWAAPDDLILLRDGTVIDAKGIPLNFKLKTFNSQLSTFNSQLLIFSSPLSPLPWGWSPLTVSDFLRAGVSADLLPTPAQLADYRAYASRHTAVCLLARLRATWPEAFQNGQLVGESVWCTSEEAVVHAIAGYGGKAMLKAPWSGSGRGVKKVVSPPQGGDVPFPWIRRILQRQGGVEVEPFYPKVQDFALEFWAKDGRVSYEGLSLFTTTDGGVYSGNLVASETEKEERLSRFIDLRLLHKLRERLILLLNESGIPAWYNGPLGIDMMITRPFNSTSSILNSQFSIFNLHPLVELNLRMTMGWVALQLSHNNPTGITHFAIVHEDGRYHASIT